MTRASVSPGLYLVFCGNHIPEYTPEREVRHMNWTWTVSDIAGLQFESLSRVVEIGTGRDVTAEMVAEVSDQWAGQGDPLNDKQRKFLELHTSVRFAREFA